MFPMTKKIVAARPQTKKAAAAQRRKKIEAAPPRRITSGTAISLGNVEDTLYDVDAMLALLESALTDSAEALELNGVSDGIDPARPISVARKLLGRVRDDVAQASVDVKGELELREAR